MFYNSIAFDFENYNEFLCYYTIENRNNSSYSFTRTTINQELGTFLIEFLNTDFRKRKNFDSFVTKYSFIDLYAKLLSKEFNEKDIFSFKFTNEELQNLLDNMYKKYSEDFIEFGEIFKDIANTKSRYKLLSNLLKTESPKESEIFDIKAYNISTKDYWQQLEEYSDLFDDICVDFRMIDFIGLYEQNNITNEIPYSFRSKDFLNIIYLSFKHIECYKHPILQCENCKKLCDYKSISEPLKEEMSQIRIEYYNFSTQYINIIGNITNKLNKVIQSNHYSNETQKLMFRLKEMENEMTSGSDKLIILQLISNFNNYNFFNEYKEIFEKELTEKIKGNEHERKMIQELLDYYKLNNYDLTKFNQEVLSEDNVTELNKMNGNYIALRDKIIKCQSLIQYEIEILKNQLK